MEQPPPYSPEGPHHHPQRGYQGYEPLPNTDYTPQQQAGYPPQKQYEGGYQNQGYPPQNPGYPPQYSGYPPQGQETSIQQPAGFSSQSTSNTIVVVQNQPQLPTGVRPVVNDRMTLSVLVCVFCCPLIGIFAILKSSEARNRYAAGDYAGAVASARRARKLAFVAVVCGLIFNSLYLTAIALSA